MGRLLVLIAPVSSYVKIFVGNLNFRTEDRDLSDFFSDCGEVLDSRVISDRNTGRSKGFGFVTFANADGPVAARKKTGEDFMGRDIRIEFASENPPPRRDGGGGGGYGGGGGGGGGYRGGGGDRDRPYERRGGGGGGYGGGGGGGRDRDRGGYDRDRGDRDDRGSGYDRGRGGDSYSSGAYDPRGDDRGYDRGYDRDRRDY